MDQRLLGQHFKGEIMDAATMTALLNMALSIGGSMMGKGTSSGQRRDENTIKDILASINGQGPYSDMFNVDYDAFQKSYVDPAMSQFNNVTAPNIQQNSIASGQQRGTGMQDELSRAGVNMQDMLNQQYAGMQEKANTRKYNALQGTLGQGQGSNEGGIGQALAGFSQSPGANDIVSQLVKAIYGGGSGQDNQGTTSGNSVNPAGNFLRRTPDRSSQVSREDFYRR